MAAAVRFDNYHHDLGKGVHDFSSHVLKLALLNSAPDKAADAGLADLSEITAGNGYAAGGMTCDTVTWTTAAGVPTLDIADETLVASGGSIGPFRYVALYNDTSTGDRLICYWDLGADQTILDGADRNFTIDTSGLWSLQ